MRVASHRSNKVTSSKTRELQNTKAVSHMSSETINISKHGNNKPQEWRNMGEAMKHGSNEALE
jgi:hypothetical protein